MREYALPVAGVLLNLALNLSIAKDWTKRLPDWIVVVLWVLSLLPLGYWLWTHPRIFTFLRTRYTISMTFIVLLGALCGGGLAGMTYAFWYHSRTQTASTTPPPAPTPQEQTSDKKKEDKKDVATADAKKKNGTHKATAAPSVTAQQPTFSVTNSSGSIINQGSTVNAPQTVNNFGPPPAKITTWEQKPAQWQEAGGLVPETQLTLTIDHSMEIPAFAVKCDRPCRVREAVVFGAYNKVNYLTTGDPNIAGAVFLSPRPLGAGVEVEYRVRAQDGSLPKILEVSTISPEQIK